jgi:hypothetical protein
VLVFYVHFVSFNGQMVFLWLFGTFCGHLVNFFRFGMLYLKNLATLTQITRSFFLLKEQIVKSPLFSISIWHFRVQGSTQKPTSTQIWAQRADKENKRNKRHCCDAALL